MALVLSNCPPASAEQLARALVEQRCAACVTLSEVKSVYRWQGELCIDQEVTLTAKVSLDLADRCVSTLIELHPYELPEVITLLVDSARSHPDYLHWVAEECSREE
jgi:periplasmic divalent cation tolerance protein